MTHEEAERIIESQGQAAVDEHRLWFLEEHLVRSTLDLCRGDRGAARAMLLAAIEELGLPR